MTMRTIPQAKSQSKQSFRVDGTPVTYFTNPLRHRWRNEHSVPNQHRFYSVGLKVSASWDARWPHMCNRHHDEPTSSPLRNDRGDPSSPSIGRFVHPSFSLQKDKRINISNGFVPLLTRRFQAWKTRGAKLIISGRCSLLLLVLRRVYLFSSPFTSKAS